MSVNREVCAKKNYRETSVPPFKYYIQIKIPNINRSGIVYTIHEELHLKYLNQSAIIRIHYDIDSIILETVLNLPFYKPVERYSVAKQSASYIIKELMKKKVDPINYKLEKIKKIIKSKHNKSRFNKVHASLVTLINDTVIGRDILNRYKLFNLYFRNGNLQFHNLIIKLELNKEVKLRLFFGTFFDGLKFHSRFKGIDWYELASDIRIGFDGNNALNVFFIGNGDDIVDTMITRNPYDKFFSILNRLYMSLGISAVDVVNVYLESGHICCYIDIGDAIGEVYGVPILNQRNDNKRNLMEFGCIGFSELIDNSCLNESGHSHHEAHYNNHNNISIIFMIPNYLKSLRLIKLS